DLDLVRGRRRVVASGGFEPAPARGGEGPERRLQRVAQPLEDGTGASASVVHETDGTSRLTLSSKATGYGNRLTFSDPDGLLAELQVSSTAVRSGTGGGAVREVGTGPDDSALSAAFTLDGLEIYRDTNSVDDALDGVTLTLTKVTDAPEALAIGPDTTATRKDIDAFVKEYNALVTFVADKSRVDPDAGTRGVFASDTSVRGLRTGLRGDLLSGVTGGEFSRLADIGIETNRDGTLTVADSAALNDALATSSADVANLFTADDGIASRFASRLESLLGASGSIESRKESVDARIESLSTQIERWDARLQTREDSLREQFARLQQQLAQAEGQQASIQSLFFF
ncbi:flagellar filament capping protein FliD, partial [Rubrivirga sp.]|uniref:flagellar filament capping protein FliD n=1 Tax=Rubrivirga sp. TaxID=1885344 RepID=UPI003C709CD6